MDREPLEPFSRDWEETTNVGVTRGLEQLRDALTPDDENEGHLVRRHRGVIVLATVLAAFWLGVAGAFAAVTREGQLSESLLAFEPELAAPAAAVPIGPNEWPLIAIAPRELKFGTKVKPKQESLPAKPRKKRAHPR